MSVENQKTEFRKKLEELEEEVHKSWLKDLDKTKEFKELIIILQRIHESESIEEIFQNNQSDFSYFIGKFSYETISNILRQHYVYGENGDDVAFEVLLNYLRIFFKFMEKQNYLQLFDSIKEIFDPSKSFYRGHSYSLTKVMNEKKILTAEKFNELLPRLKNNLDLAIGQEIDVLTESRKSYNPYQERKIWTRGIVKRVDSEYLTVLIADDDNPICIRKLGFDYASKGTMAKDYEWRISLEEGDNIDCYDRGKWYPSTILSARKENVNGLIKAEYKIGFRLYIDRTANWKDYQKFWPDKIGIQKDSNGIDYIGDSENVDELIPSYSKRIQKLNTCIYNESNADSNENENYLVDEVIIFNNGDIRNYVIARNNSFSFYFALLLTEFSKIGGFEKMVEILTIKEKPHGDIVCLCFNILSQCSSLFHKEYIKKIGHEMKNNVISFLNDLTQNEMRNIKKDTIDVILKVLKFYLNFTVGAEEKNKIIEKFSITFSTKMLKTSFLDKRIQAVKTLVDIIRTSKGDPNKSEIILKILEESQIFNEIYGPNSHIQLINKSKDLLEIMIQEDKLSDGEMELIWASTKKGDLEGKLTILKTLKEISKSLKQKHIKLLLNNIYSSNGELIKEEIDLIYELSIQGAENLERCIDFFTKSLLLSKSDEGEKITTLINKIFDITKLNPTFRINVIELCISSLEKSENTILALKILQKYIKEINLSIDYDMYKLLIEDNKLNSLFCNNFKTYKEFVKEKSMNFKDDIDLLPIDNFTHTQNLKARLEFINTLLSNNLWKIQEDPIDFLYSIMIVESISEKDTNEFFFWIKKIIEEDVVPQEKIYNLFTEKICLGNCHNLSLQAFDSYLKVFLDFNEREKNLKYLKNSKCLEIILFGFPENLVGFEMLWKIVFESFSKEIMNKGIEILHTLYTTALVKGGKVDQSQKLLQRCIDLIKNTVESNSSDEEKHNIISKCLYVLKLMIEESEKNGTAGVKSHFCLLKRKVIALKIVDIERNNEFYIKVYSNTTMWDLKEIIAKKIKICFDFLKFTIKQNYEIRNTDNGKNILEMNLSDNDEIKVSKNNLENLIKQADLAINGEVSDAAAKIFNDWFDEFSSDNRMSKEDCARFVRTVTGQKEDSINIEDTRIKNLFEAYDRNNDGFLEREEFTGFYRECSIKSEKRRAVLDNLKSMGIRNDLKRMDEPYENHNKDKKILPRYNLSYNQEFFDTIFKLQDLGDNIASEAFKFLCLISTNPVIFNNILLFEGNEWEEKIDSKNMYKLIYSLQIIEYFLEDVEADTNAYSSVKQEIADEIGIGSEEFKEKKIVWIENFLTKGGFNHIINIFNLKLDEYVCLLNKETPVMMKMCIEFLLKIVKVFYFSSLSKNNEIVTEKNFSIQKTFQTFNKEDLMENINKSIDSLFYTEKFIDLIIALLNKTTKSIEDVNIIENSFDFLCGLLRFSENYNDLEKFILSQKQNEFKVLSTYGLLNSNYSIRIHFSNSLIKLAITCNSKKSFSFLLFMFSFIFEIFGNFNKEQERNSAELFDFFSTLLELYLKNSIEYNCNSLLILVENLINPQDLIIKIIETVNKDISEEGNISLSNELFMGYMKIITNVCDTSNEFKKILSTKYNLIQAIMTRILFKQNSLELMEKLSKLNFINPHEFEDNKSSRATNQQLRQVCYKFILTMLKNSIENFEKFFSVNILDSEKKEEKKVSSKENRYSYISNYGRNEGHVGLKNLGCICYMNSMLQQYFMTPALRYNILKVNDNITANKSNTYNIDDNVLHQVQRMFSFLELSQRQDYNPYGFCYSFKDFDGNPTNTMIQQDSQEFLNRFFDKVENSLKQTMYKYLLQSVYGGKTCSQLICENGCGSVKNRYEDFYNLSLEVNNMKTLNDSLEKFITPELIDEYSCETCKKKVTIKKRNSLAELPNVLIVHLQRIFYNYETDRNEKINSRLEFPRILNLLPFTIEELTRKSSCKTKKMENEIQIETEETYFKHQSYYEYHLVGVVVHTGSADSGHYYSYINTVRNGNDNEMTYNPNDDSHINNWLEFNDSYISKFNVNRLEDECFGGSYNNNNDSWARMGEKIKSAYMLVYERRIKTPLKMIISQNSIEDKNSTISFKEEETLKIKKSIDLFRSFGTNTYKEAHENLLKSVFYDVSKDEYFHYINYYTREILVPKNYYLEVTDDNSIFQKQQNISDEHFVTFFDSVINVLDETLSQMKDVSDETSIKIATTFMNFIFNILSQKDKHKLLKTAKDKFLHILGLSSSSLRYVIEYLITSQKQLLDNLLNENTIIVSTNCDLLYELIEQAYNFSPPLFKECIEKKNLEDTLTDNLVKLLDIILSIFPKVPSKFVQKIGPILSLLKNINQLGDIMSQFFIRREAISTFITYLLGKESPSYNETVSRQGEHWDIGRFNISNTDDAVDFIYDLFSKSNEKLENKIHEKIDAIILSEKDQKHIKHSNFMKFLFKNREILFSKLLVDLSFQNEEFTKKSCNEITKYIEDIGLYDDTEIIKLFHAIQPLLNINDDYQRMRFEYIIGFPQLIIDEPTSRYVFPFFGFHKMRDIKSKIYEYTGLTNHRLTCCFLKKLFNIRGVEKAPCEIFLNILEAADLNPALLKYIRFMPAESQCDGDFIMWGVHSIKTVNKKYNTNFDERLEKLAQSINNKLTDIFYNNSILHSFKGFIDINQKYLIMDIYSEEITQVRHKDNVYLFQIEYYTTIDRLDENSNLEFNDSKSNYYSEEEKEDKIKAEEFNKFSENENTVFIDQAYKINDEKEFFKNILVHFTQGKKVVVIAKNKSSNAQVYSTFIRFVVFNNSPKEASINLRIIRQSTPESCNEYIPVGPLHTEVNSYCYKTIYNTQKVFPHQPWTDNLGLDFEFSVALSQYRVMQPSGFSDDSESYNAKQQSLGSNNVKQNYNMDFEPSNRKHHDINHDSSDDD